jgi:Family of unknown function (DUF6535)
MIWTASLYLYALFIPLYSGLCCVNGHTHQAGLFSGVLTAFIIDRNQNLQPNPAQQSAYFQQQSNVLLNQISHQLTSLGAQFPSNLSLPGPTFSLSRSDVRVTIYWFSSLVFSLSAALLATLIQRWARDHMYIFQYYSDPLKVARIRQYLYEGVQHRYMPASAEAVPGLINISLFLFFIGLADFLLSTHTIVGKFFIFLLSLIVTLYIITTVAPLINPQAPYRTCFSGFVWCLSRKLHKCWCKDRFGGSGRPLSSNIADGWMQLAMEKNDARKGRDERAIRWLVNKLGEDIKLESLLSRIPGSFNAKWGVEVWNAYPKIRMDENATSSSTEPTPALPDDNISDSRPPQPLRRRGIGILLSYVKRSSRTRLHPIVPTSHFLRGGEVNELCLRIQRLFETCNRDSFSNQDEWRRRSRACVETAASFVLYIGVDIGSFGDIGKVLSDLGNAERTREVTSASLNLSFISRWTCLSIVLIRKLLDSPRLREDARGLITTLETLYGADNFDLAETAHNTARRMDEEFVAAWDLVEKLRRAFEVLAKEDRGGVKEILSNYKPELEQIQAQAVRMQSMDKSISDLQKQIDQVTHKLIRQLPGVAFDELTEPTTLSHVFDFLASPAYPQLLYLSPRLLGLCSLGDERIETTEVLKAMKTLMPRRSAVSQCRAMERQLWRLEDLRIGAFGFTLELYLLSLRQILPTFTSQPSDTHVSFYINAFKAITSDREQFKRSRGTLQIVLNLVLDMAVRDRGIFSNFEYPSYIRWELLELLDAMVKGEASLYIDDAMAELNNVGWRTGNEEFLNHASRIIGSRMGQGMGVS